MGFLKKLDIFRGINEEHREGTCLGVILTFVSIFLIFFFFGKEIRNYRFQKLDTNLFVYNSSSDIIPVKFDISVYKIKCPVLVVGTGTIFGRMKLDKLPEGDGCRLKGEFKTKNDKNNLTIAPNFQSSMNEMLGMMLKGSHQNNHLIVKEGTVINSSVSSLI
jgi:hypothetical protein